jgi:predicted DNA-binding protein
MKLAIEISAELAERLDAYAKERGTTASAVVEQLLAPPTRGA